MGSCISKSSNSRDSYFVTLHFQKIQIGKNRNNNLCNSLLVIANIPHNYYICHPKLKKEALELLDERIAYYGDEEDEDYDDEAAGMALILYEDVTNVFEDINRAREWAGLKKKVESFLEWY